MSAIVLKLGGSIIAPKGARRPFLRKKLLKDIGWELSRVFPDNKHPLVIIHGGGSFCHPLAKKFNLAKGTMDNKAKEEAGYETRRICRDLSGRVVRILSKYLPVSIIDTPSIAVNRNGKLENIDVNPILEVIRGGGIPILSGHIVPDKTLGMSIASGDRLASAIAEKIVAESVFFASDVNGVFEEDPHINRRARHIPEISFSVLERSNVLSGAAHIDATGGMREKFSAFFEQKNSAVRRVSVFDGRNTNAFSKLTDKTFPFGTTVRP